MRSGGMLVGWGMATATYPANREESKASALIRADGTALVRSGTHDLGTGTYTIMTQIAAEALGLPVSKVRFELGDTLQPEAAGAGGSKTTASVGPAVYAAAKAARDKVVAMAVADRDSPLHGLAPDAVDVDGGWLMDRQRPDRREPMVAVLARHGGAPVEALSDEKPGEEKKQYSMHSFGAVFVEVHVDPDLGTIRVPRVVGVYGIGRLMNEEDGLEPVDGRRGVGPRHGADGKDARSTGATGRAVNANLADYHVPVNADIGSIDVSVVEEHDPHINVLGAKGIGEIGIVGVAAALAQCGVSRHRQAGAGSADHAGQAGLKGRRCVMEKQHAAGVVVGDTAGRHQASSLMSTGAPKGWRFAVGARWTRSTILPRGAPFTSGSRATIR